MATINSTLGSTTLTALRNLGSINLQTNRSAQKLATGQRINRGADDPAGLISSERLRAELAALEAETRVLERSDAVGTTAEGALNEVSSILTDINGLQVQLNNDGFSDAEKAAIQQQIDSGLQAIDRISSNSSFNGQNLLDGSLTLEASGETVNVDSTSSANLGETDIGGQTFRLSDIGSGGALDGDGANAQLVIQNAISEVATTRGSIGAFQRNTIRSSLNSTRVAIENVTAAESSIRDTNFAAETANQARLQVLGRAAIQTLNVLNNNRRNVLDLLS